MYRYIFDVLLPKCTGTFLTYKKGLNVQYIFAGLPPLRGGDFPIKDGDFPANYVSLPEGRLIYHLMMI